MKYLEFRFSIRPASDDLYDVLCSVLAEVGFESFVTPENDDEPLLAYIKKEEYDADALSDILHAFPIPDVEINHAFSEAEDRDWNAEWEQHYFQPLVVADRCVVSATFHKDVPHREFNITINPRMSFGTGHHDTTSLMMQNILNQDLEGQCVLDMGCGTSILGILCALKGASHVIGIDVDEWCIINSEENIQLNGVDAIVSARLGDASSITNGDVGDIPAFDVVLANIQRNVVTKDMPAYAAALRPGGKLFTSGFYETDLAVVREAAERAGLIFLHAQSTDRHWCCAAFQK